MEFSEMLNYVLYVVLTVIMPVVATYAVNLIKAKIKESNIIADATKNEDLSKIVESALSDVMDAVLYINQIYVVSDEAKKVIEQLYGSFDKWLKLKIESSVNMAKRQ